MSATALFIENLIKYTDFIKIGNRGLKNNFVFEGSPVIAKRQKIIPGKGEIETEIGNMLFWFHGDGCEFTFANVVVDFDYIFLDENCRSFKPYFFYIFFQNNSFTPSLLKDNKIFNETLIDLVKTGFLKQREGDFIAYDY